MKEGKGNLAEWKEQATADAIFRARDQSSESQAGRLLEYTPDSVNKRVTGLEAPHLKVMADAADYLGEYWMWVKRSNVRHEIYGMSQSSHRQAARDDFGTVLSGDLREKKEQAKQGLFGGLFDKLLGRSEE